MDQQLCCIHCGAPVTWEEIDFGDGSVDKTLRWTCDQCGQQVFDIGFYKK